MLVPATEADPSCSRMSSGLASKWWAAISLSRSARRSAASLVAPPAMTMERLAKVPQP